MKMKLDNLKQSVSKVAGKISDNKSTLFMYGGITGVVGVGYTGITGALKAKEILDEVNGEVDKATAIDIAKCFIPCGIATAGTILCIIGMRKDYVSQIATLAAIKAADVSGSTNLGLAKSEETTTDGRKVESAAVNASQKKRIYDEFSGRFIETTVMDIERAKDDANEEFLAGASSYYASEFYEKLTDGYFVPESIEDLKWFAEDGILKIDYDSGIDENMNTYLIFKFNRRPETELSHSI